MSHVPFRPKYVLGETTVIAALSLLFPSQAHHIAWYVHDAGRRGGAQEVWCFDSGAKLYRAGSHLWFIYGYFDDGSDGRKAAAAFDRARRTLTHKETA